MCEWNAYMLVWALAVYVVCACIYLIVWGMCMHVTCVCMFLICMICEHCICCAIYTFVVNTPMIHDVCFVVQMCICTVNE